MLLEAKSLTGRCHGNGMTITVSLWLCDFYVIMNLLRQLFWHSEKVTYQLFHWACMILRENANQFSRYIYDCFKLRNITINVLLDHQWLVNSAQVSYDCYPIPYVFRLFVAFIIVKYVRDDP